MSIVRILVVGLLSLSMVLGGRIAEAHECPQARMMRQDTAPQSMNTHDCCAEEGEKQHQNKSSGCCDDAACGAYCSISGSNMSIPPVVGKYLPYAVSRNGGFFIDEAALVSHILNTQDRPPKSLG